MKIEDARLDSLILAKEFICIAKAVEDAKVQSVLIQFAYEEKLHADYLESLLTNNS